MRGVEEDDPKILRGVNLPVEIPNITLGQFMFQKLISSNLEDNLMYEAESGRSVTVSQFVTLCIKVAEGLKAAGLQPEDVVCVIGKAGIDVYATATGTLFQGGTVFPLDHNMPTEVMEQILKTTEPKFVFCDADISDDVTEVLAQLNLFPRIILLNGVEGEEMSNQTFDNFAKLEVDLNDYQPVSWRNPLDSIAFLVCSSGTTGTPKPIMLTHENLLYQTKVWSALTCYNKLLACPAITFSYFFWISGILLYMSTICLNLEITIVQKLEARHVLRTIEKYKPIWGLFSPALAKYLTNHPDFKTFDVSSISLMVTGGCPLQKVVAEKIRERWGFQMACRQSYGMTEVAGSLTASSMEDDVLSVGKLLPGCQLKITNVIDGSLQGPRGEGEIVIRCPSLMKGYLKNEEATKAVLKNGWYHTGDIGYYTEKGSVYITGRVKDIIKCNNKQILPNELEELIMAIPGVADVGVAGVKVDDENYVPVAVVIKKEGYEVTKEEILNRVEATLPEYKKLRGVYFVEAIPRTPSGKMKRPDLLNIAQALYTEI